MLVSLITSLRATSMQYNAAYNMMQSRNAMLSAIRNTNPNNLNFGTLHRLDNQLALDMANSKFQYQVASAMKKNADAQLKNEQRLNTIA